MIEFWNPPPPATPPEFASGDTVPEMFVRAVALRSDRVALRQKVLGIWEQTTWQEMGDIVRELTGGLAALGFEPGDCASILANTRREWLYADLAVLCAGGVSSGIYPTDAPSQCEYLLSDSGSVLVFVEDDEQLDKILQVRDRLPGLRWIVVVDMKGLRDFSDPRVMSLEALRTLGRERLVREPGLFEQRVAARQREDLAILIYTSGTTGKPKGAMISHRNIICSLRIAAEEVVPCSTSDERMCFLPLCHAVERLLCAYMSVYAGPVLNFVERPETVPENVREIAPTVLFFVPRLWEKFHASVTLAVADASRLQQLAYRWAMGLGMRVVDSHLEGRPVPAGLRWRYRLARWVVLDNIRRMIGMHRVRLGGTGAAPISPELIRWYMALGVPMFEAYGMTECAGAATSCLPGKSRPGTIGRAVAGFEVAVSPEGELLVRSETVFMGYLNQPEKTAETLRDGWLHTGDVGTVDEDGYFRITDRLKDIIITAGGKNVSPSEIESELKFSPFITDAVVIGDRRPYLTALIMIDQENVERHAQDHEVPFSDFASLCRAPEVQALIARVVEQVNGNFARVEQIKAFRLIEQRLTAEDEELTPTMKLKRALVQRKYSDLVDAMYTRAA